MLLLALTARQFEVILGGVFVLWLVVVTGVAAYGRQLGYPFFPLFVVSLVLPFGWALVLLVVTICAGPRLKKQPPEVHRPIGSRKVPPVPPPVLPTRRGEDAPTLIGRRNVDREDWE